jgi:hypothetical protein
MKYTTALATPLFFAATSTHAATVTIGYEFLLHGGGRETALPWRQANA